MSLDMVVRKHYDIDKQIQDKPDKHTAKVAIRSTFAVPVVFEVGVLKNTTRASPPFGIVEPHLQREVTLQLKEPVQTGLTDYVRIRFHAFEGQSISKIDQAIRIRSPESQEYPHTAQDHNTDLEDPQNKTEEEKLRRHQLAWARKTCIVKKVLGGIIMFAIGTLLGRMIRSGKPSESL